MTRNTGKALEIKEEEGLPAIGDLGHERVFKS